MLEGAARVLSGRETLTPVQLPPHLRIPGRTVVVRALACCLGMLATAAWMCAGEPEKRKFDVPADLAEKSLRVFSVQSGSEVLFASDAASGVRTNAIKGEFLPGEAVKKMLTGTTLYVRDERDGVFRIAATPRPKAPGAALSPGPSDRPGENKSGARSRAPPPGTSSAAQPNQLQTSQPQHTESPPVKNRNLFSFLAGWLAAGAAAGAQTAAPSKEEVVTLSPFEVSASNRGYYGSNTMSGTRLNSRVEDLASSITVVTKQQMQDFAMLDINDIFNYEVSTEGTGNYTALTFNGNGDPTDDVQLNPNSANRIRGLGPANISFGNFSTSGRVPVDRVNIDAVEISRGPNSTIFGLGSPGGTVNMVPASPNLLSNRSQVEFRVDSYDGYRSSIDLNRVLIKGTLAVRGSAIAQHEGFVRKPSGVDTTRFNGMVKYQPFKKTTVTASFERYRLEGRRPNMTPPGDTVTTWLNAGSPAFDPVTRTVYLGGQSIGSFTEFEIRTKPIPYFTNNVLVSSGGGTSLIAVNPDGSVGLWMPARPSTTAVNNPFALNDQGSFFVATNAVVKNGNQPLFATALPVSNKAIYDWSAINLAAMNNQVEATSTSIVQLEQFFVDTPRHLLGLQVGWYQEDSSSYRRLINGTASSTGTSASFANSNYLFVDPNMRLLDGRPNPYFLRPYIGESSPRTTLQPLKTQTYRAQLAYRLDLGRENGLAKWIGVHQASAYGEYRHTQTRRFAFRDVMVSNHTWLAAGVPRANQSTAPAPQNLKTYNLTSPSGTRGWFQYYVGDNVGGNVDYAPTAFKYGSYPFSWGRNSAGEFVQEPAQLGEAAAVDGTAGSNNSNTILKTRGVVLQSTLLQGRLVSTLGLRQDTNLTKSGVPASLLPDGVTHDYANDNLWLGDWLQRGGRTKTAGVVVKPFRWLFLHLNRSDSFIPSTPAQNLHLEQLPNPTGKGKDYGFTLNLFQDTLTLRVNRYTTLRANARNGNSTGFAGRIIKLDFWDLSTAAGFGLNARAAEWLTRAAEAKGTPLTPDQLAAQVADIMKLPLATFTAMSNFTDSAGKPNPLVNPIAATDDIRSNGTEVELNYTPNKWWTVKFNAAEQETITSAIAPDLLRWIDERMPVWRSVVDLDTQNSWFSGSYLGSPTAEAYLKANITTPLAIVLQQLGKSQPQIRRYRFNLSTRYQLAGVTENKWLKRLGIGGSLRWEDKGAIGYYGVQKLPGVVTALDPNRPVYDKAHYYADVFFSYRTKLFRDKVGATFQLNVRNLQESGRLQPISAWPDGTPNAYRIIDPRQFILSATFEL